MEPMAEKMLQETPGLREEFEQMKKQDTSFASSSFLMLNWFYSKTPYWDPAKNIYPVGRIYDRFVVDKLVNAR
jgi:hypothetical protein